jgi:hypothetical protein
MMVMANKTINLHLQVVAAGMVKQFYNFTSNNMKEQELLVLFWKEEIKMFVVKRCN